MRTPEIIVELPPVYFPMPLRCHSEVDTLEKRGLAWMAGHGFCATPTQRERVEGTMTARFFGHICPDAELDRLQAATDWGYLMFVFDDAFDDESDDDIFAFTDVALRLVRTLEVPDAGVLSPQHPFSAPVIDLAERIHRMFSPTNVQRMVDAHRAWLFGSSWMTGVRRLRVTPSLNDYLFTRLLDAAALPTLTWFQLSEPHEIPTSQLTAPRVRALTEMAGLAAALDDDLYSRGKDLWLARHRGTTARDLTSSVDVLMAATGCPPQQAIEQVVALRDRIVARFTELRDLVAVTAEPPLERYLSNLTCLLRGNFSWGLTADRYSNPDGKHPGAVRTTGTVSDRPSQTGAPPIPSISWWWSV